MVILSQNRQVLVGFDPSEDAICTYEEDGVYKVRVVPKRGLNGRYFGLGIYRKEDDVATAMMKLASYYITGDPDSIFNMPKDLEEE